MTTPDGLIEVRPGLKFIVRIGPGISLDQARVMKDRLAEELPGVDVVVISCEQIAVYDLAKGDHNDDA